MGWTKRRSAQKLLVLVEFYRQFVLVHMRTNAVLPLKYTTGSQTVPDSYSCLRECTLSPGNRKKGICEEIRLEVLVAGKLFSRPSFEVSKPRCPVYETELSSIFS